MGVYLNFHALEISYFWHEDCTNDVMNYYKIYILKVFTSIILGHLPGEDITFTPSKNKAKCCIIAHYPIGRC